MIRWMIFVIALLAMAKAWMVESRVIALEKRVEMVANLSLAMGESVNKLLKEQISQLEQDQIQVEVEQESDRQMLLMRRLIEL